VLPVSVRRFVVDAFPWARVRAQDARFFAKAHRIAMGFAVVKPTEQNKRAGARPALEII
jgi:hypothetical protein